MKLACLVWWLAQAAAAPVLAQAGLTLGVVGGDAGSATITLAVVNDAGIRPELTGFDIYRWEAGARHADGSCVADIRPVAPEAPTTWTRVTATPLVRQQGGGWFQVLDAGLAHDRLYRYVAYPVDAARVPAEAWDAFDLRRNNAPLQVGRPVLAAGQIVGVVWAAEIHSCPTWCGLGLIAKVQAYGFATILNDGVDYEFFGHFEFQSSDLGSTLVIDAAVPTTCALAVAPSRWGSVKTLFR